MTKILLGIPCGGTVHMKTMVSVVQTIVQNSEILDFLPVAGALGPENRNALAQEAVDGGYTHLWLVDADMKFAADALPRLLAHDADVVGCAYNRRGLPLQTTVRIQDEHGTIGIPTGPLPAEVFGCYAIGSGCQLIKTSALRQISKPWFCTAYEGDLFMDDAVWFGRATRQAGLETWCDPTIPCTHLGEYEY